MGFFKGGFLRIFQSLLYLLAFCCAAIILGIYSYFLSVLADRDITIPTKEKAIEGLAGAAVVYLIFATLLTCCLGGISVFAILAIILDILFCGAMIAIAVMTRNGASGCSDNVKSPLGDGPYDSKNGFGNDQITYAVKLGTACELNTACFAVACLGALLFLFTAIMQVMLLRHHKKEKRFGPGPDNNYTSGKKRSFWNRKGKKDKHHAKDAELGTVGAAGLAAPHGGYDMRPSHDTGYTGTTVNGNGSGATKFEQPHHEPHGAHGGYHTQPQGTGVNPYGYNNTTTGTATNY